MGGMPTKSSKSLKRFGDALRAERQRLNISQEELALESDISRNYVGHIERGEKSVSLEVLVRLARTLKISVAELIARAGL